MNNAWPPDAFTLCVFWTLWTCLCLTLPPPSWADATEPFFHLGGDPGGSQPVTLKADTLEIRGKRYWAEGQVSIQQGVRSLTAASVTYDPSSGALDAEGDVQLVDGQDILSTQKIFWNMKSQKASLLDGRLYLKADNFHIHGSRIERESPERYSIAEASFTTCDEPSPTWHFSGQDIQVRLNHFLTARNVLMKVHALPVFYLPYVVLPITQSRQSGLLIPRIGYNTGEGLKVNTAYYWAIRPNQDATLNMDYYGKKGIGGGLEYRFVSSRESHGQWNSYILHDRQEQQNRWYLRYRQVQSLSARTTARLRITALNDKNIYKDISEEPGDRLLRSQDSDLYINHAWESASAHLWAQYTQNLLGSSDPLFQRLPEAGFVVAEKPLRPFPVTYGFQSSVVRWRNNTVDQTRIQIAPELSLRTHVGPVTILPRVGLRHLYYAPSSLQGDTHRNQQSYSVDIHFKARRTYTNYQHLVEPTLRYQVVTIRDTGPTPPLLDPLEAIPEKNELMMSVLNRWLKASAAPLQLTGQGVPGEVVSREAIQWRLAQGYRLAVHGVNIPPSPGRFTSLRSELSWRPTPRVTWDMDTSFSHGKDRMESVDTDVSWQAPRATLLVGQRYTLDPAIRFLTGAVAFRIEKTQSQIKVWYDTGSRTLREGNITVTYPLQCWGLTFSYTYRPDESQFNVLLTLKGVGSVGG